MFYNTKPLGGSSTQSICYIDVQITTVSTENVYLILFSLQVIGISETNMYDSDRYSVGNQVGNVTNYNA